MVPWSDPTSELEYAYQKTVVYRREVKDLTTFYKIKCGHYNCTVDSYFEFCSDKRLRFYSSSKLELNRVRTELFKGTFFNRITYLRNNLLEKLRTGNLSLFCFTKCCKELYKHFDPDRPHVTWVWYYY